MGEEPINSLAETNAFVNSALFALENANINEQSEGWWFNKESVEIIPDVNGEYIVPSDIIDLDIDTNPGWLTVRSGRLYNTDGGVRYTGTAPVKVNVLRLLAFEDVPFHGKRLIKASAVVLFQQSYDGDATKIKEAETEYMLARQLAKSQHIRAVGANFSTVGIQQSNMAGPSRGLMRTPR
jgi:hypothetical protein